MLSLGRCARYRDVCSRLLIHAIIIGPTVGPHVCARSVRNGRRPERVIVIDPINHRGVARIDARRSAAENVRKAHVRCEVGIRIDVANPREPTLDVGVGDRRGDGHVELAGHAPPEDAILEFGRCERARAIGRSREGTGVIGEGRIFEVEPRGFDPSARRSGVCHIADEPAVGHGRDC